MKQHIGGIGVHQRLLETAMDGLKLSQSDGVMVVDLHAGDGWLQEATFGMSMSSMGHTLKPKLFCGSVCHHKNSGDFMRKLVGDIIFEKCRTGSLKLAGFPEFDALIKRLEQLTDAAQAYTRNASLGYEVTEPFTDGSLVIAESLVQKFATIDEFVAELDELVSSHNKEFNKEGKARGAKRTAESAGLGGMTAQKARKSDLATVEAFKEQHPDAVSIPEPLGEWVGCVSGGLVFAPKHEAETIYPPTVECFSFGSGDWLQGRPRTR
jgi:hypothetical protein